MACALAGGWLSLAGYRGLLGLTEAAAVPAGIKVVGAWFAPKERSVAVGWLNAGTSLGALIAAPMAIGLSLSFGWRSAFVVTGLLGLIWAGLWFALYRDPPAADEVAPAQRPKVKIGDVIGRRAFWAIAIPRFLAEPAWQTFSFWIPLYLAKERGLDLKAIALFAWLPFLAADLGGVLGGYLSPFLARRFGLELLNSRVVGIAMGAVMMIAPACVGLAAGPYAAIALLCVGGFAHQVISVLINTLSADLFPARIVATANGFVGMAGWTGGLLFSLLIGALADKVGFAPLFGALGVFDLVGVAVLAGLIRGARADEA
jgi:ACS family hexuronate transporter-like MFS transporter